MQEDINLKKHILQKLIRSNIWGGKHIPLAFIENGLPAHFKNTHSGKKLLEEVIRTLTRNERIMIVAKRTGKSSSNHISLNPRKIAAIRQFLEENS